MLAILSLFCRMEMAVVSSYGDIHQGAVRGTCASAGSVVSAIFEKKFPLLIVCM